MLKIVLVDHDDLDAAGCRVVFTLAHQHLNEGEMEIIHCSNESIDNDVLKLMDSGKIDKDTVICFSDICASRGILERLMIEYGKVEVLDHHRTNFFVENIVPGAVICPENKMGKLESGTSLMYQYFSELSYCSLDNKRGELFRGDSYNKDLLALFVDTVRSYDTYEWKETGNILAKQLQTLFFLLGMERFCKKFIDRIMDTTSGSELIIADYMDFIEYKTEWEQAAINEINIENVQIVDLKGLKAAFRYTGGGVNVSELSHQFLTKYPEIDIFVSYHSPSGTFSFRTIRDDIDLGSYIAKPIGGGGHPKAAGAHVTDEVKQKLIETILQVIDSNVCVE